MPRGVLSLVSWLLQLLLLQQACCSFSMSPPSAYHDPQLGAKTTSSRAGGKKPKDWDQKDRRPLSSPEGFSCVFGRRSSNRVLLKAAHSYFEVKTCRFG